MESLIQISVEEIAIEGDSGCSLNRLFNLLNDRFELQSYQVATDESIQRFILSHLIQSTKCIFNSTKFKSKETLISLLSSSLTASNEWSKTIKPSMDDIKFTAIEELRNLALFGDSDPNSNKLSPTQSDILSFITSKRKYGASQVDIAKSLNIDPRSTFHYLKVLDELGYIVKKPWVLNGTNTNICLNVRFLKEFDDYYYSQCTPQQNVNKTTVNPNTSEVSNQSEEESAEIIAINDKKNSNNNLPAENIIVKGNPDAVRQDICRLLSAATNQIMTSEDLTQAFPLNLSPGNNDRRWFNRQLGYLTSNGYIEKVQVERQVPAKGAHSLKLVKERCFRLVNPFVIKTVIGSPAKKEISTKMINHISAEQQDNQEPDDDTSNMFGQGGILAELPFIYQIQHVIALSGTEGITTVELAASLSNTYKAVYRILNKVSQIKTTNSDNSIKIHRVSELCGKERRYRYYSLDAWIALTKGETIPAVRYTRQISDDIMLLRSRATQSSSSSTSCTSNTENNDLSSSNSVLKNIHQTTTTNRMTITTLRRHKVLLNILEECKMIEINTEFCNLLKERSVSAGETEMKEHILDKKTVVRAAEKLDAEGKLKLSQIQFNSIGGSLITVRVILHSDMDEESEEFKYFVRKIKYRGAYQNNSVGKPKEENIIQSFDVDCLDQVISRLQEIEQQQHDTAMHSSKTSSMAGRSSATPNASGTSTPLSHIIPTLRQSSYDSRSSSTFVSPLVSPRKKPLPGSDSQAGSAARYSYRKKYNTNNDNNLQQNVEKGPNMTYRDQTIPKMLRAKVIHEYIVSKILQNTRKRQEDTSHGPYKNGGVFNLAQLFFEELPFGILEKLVSIPVVESKVLSEFVQLQGHEEVAYRDLDPRVAISLSGCVKKFRSSISSTLKILEHIGIVAPCMKNDEKSSKTNQGNDDVSLNSVDVDMVNTPSHLNPNDNCTSVSSGHLKYRLLRTVPLKNYALEDRPILGYFSINSKEDCRYFWSQLECVCCQSTSTKGATSNNRQSKLWFDQVDDTYESTATNSGTNSNSTNDALLKEDDDPLKFITLVRNWKEIKKFTPMQRAILDGYLDHENGTTPSNDATICRQLASITELSLNEIRYYFKRFEYNSNRRKNAQNTLKLTRMNTMGTTNSINRPVNDLAQDSNGDDLTANQSLSEINASSNTSSTTTNSKDNQKKINEAKKKIKDALSRINRQLTDSHDINTADLAAMNHQELLYIDHSSIYRSRKRNKWTADEDETILCAYSILIESGRRILWHSVAKLFPKDSRKGMMKDICRRRSNYLTRDHQGSARVEFFIDLWSKNKHEWVSAEDLKDFEKDGDASDYDISKFVRILKEKASIANHSSGTSSNEGFVTSSGSSVVLPETIEEFYMQYYITKSNSDSKINPKDLEKQNSSRSKLIYLYSRPFVVDHQEINSENQKQPGSEQKSNEYEEKNKEKLIIKSLIKAVLITPDAKYNPMKAFMSLSHFETQDVDLAIRELYDEGYISPVKGAEERRLPGRGFQLSDRFLSTFKSSFPKYLVPSAHAYYKLLEDKGEDEFSSLYGGGIVLACIAGFLNGKIKMNIILRKNWLKEDWNKFKIQIKMINNVTTNKRSRHGEDLCLVKKRITNLKDKVSATDSFDDIEKKVFDMLEAKNSVGMTVDDLNSYIAPNINIVDFKGILRKLIEESKIIRVGSMEIRYVLKEYELNWGIPMSFDPETKTYSSSNKTYIPTRMWYDLDGTWMDIVYRACVESVFSLIVKHPGINRKTLSEMTCSLLSSVELEDALETLIQNEHIRYLFVEPSSFDFQHSKHNVLDGNQLTCYFSTIKWIEH